MPWDTWNPSDGSNLTLSSANLRAAAAASGVGFARSLHHFSTGKYYFELGSFANILNNNTGINVCDAAWTPAGAGHSVGYTALGSHGLGNIAINVAVDCGAKLLWGRQTTTGNWNGSGTADPAAGVGGVSISTLVGDVYVMWYFGTGGAGNEAMTWNSGGSTFAGVVPSGYTPGWPVPVSPSVLGCNLVI